MAAAKLTLSVDAKVIARAKLFAKKSGTSVSRLVETYLNSLGEPEEPEELPPVLPTRASRHP
jgi:hypothetical protein